MRALRRCGECMALPGDEGRANTARRFRQVDTSPSHGPVCPQLRNLGRYSVSGSETTLVLSLTSALQTMTEPTQFGSWEVVHTLGEGGQGRVHHRDCPR